MGKYVNGTFVPDENDLLLQQQQKMAGLQSAPQPQQAVSQPAPVTQPNPEVAEFAKAKTNNQSNNSPRVAGQAGTVYNIFKQPAVEQAQRKAQPVFTPVQPSQTKQETQTTPVIRSTDELAKAMGYTSPEEEEKMRKASVANQRIMAVADALRQIGNIYNTVHYAPSQQFNSPVEMERQRYQQAKALRDRANQTYISYQQAKAKQEAQQREWDRNFEYKVGKDDRDFKFNAAKAAAEHAEKQRQYDSTLAFNKEKEKNANAIKREQIAQSDRNNRRSVGATYASINQRKNEFEYKKNHGYYDRGSGGGSTRAGYTYSTKNGSVTIPSDYLSRNKINKRSLLTAMERAGAIDSEWLNNYDRAFWNKEQQDKMLDDAVSEWLMTDDSAEEYMVKHLKGQSSGSPTSMGTMPGVGGSGDNNKTMPGVK